MPVTTYLNNEPGLHSDNEINEMVRELSYKTGEKWYCTETIADYRKKYIFFGPYEYIKYTELLKHLSCIEYQILTCVSTPAEAKAYLFGALGQLKKREHEKD